MVSATSSPTRDIDPTLFSYFPTRYTLFDDFFPTWKHHQAHDRPRLLGFYGFSASKLQYENMPSILIQWIICPRAVPQDIELMCITVMWWIYFDYESQMVWQGIRADKTLKQCRINVGRAA